MIGRARAVQPPVILQHPMPLLFSYGTLQQDDVQLSTFGQLLQGSKDELPGFEPSLVPVENQQVIAATGRTHHANVTFNGRNDSRVIGTVFEVTDAELEAADRFEEPANYARIAVTLASGKHACVYVSSPRPSGVIEGASVAGNSPSSR